MAKRKTTPAAKDIEQYTHADKDRANNPPVGLVTPETDKNSGKQTYSYDPHLDPQLQWAGKAEHTSFEVPTVSLHVHERIDPRTIIESVRRRHEEETGHQFSLFDSEQMELPLFKAVEFYKHRHNWANRLIAGDSTLVMNSLLIKEGMAGQVQMIYFDPPYGIKYGSNFQPFVNKRDVKDGKDDDLTSEPETLKAFRDTWELGIHSYLTYLRDRLLLARDLLHESGSIFVQISDENVHLVRNLLDEVFGGKNFMSQISFRKTSNLTSLYLPTSGDFIIWFAKDKSKAKYNQLFIEKTYKNTSSDSFGCVEMPDNSWRRLTSDEKDSPQNLAKTSKLFGLSDLTSSHFYDSPPFEYEGKTFTPKGRYWSTSPNGLKNLEKANRLAVVGDTLRYKRYFSDFPVMFLGNNWEDTGTGTQTEERIYVVQTGIKAVQRCMLMTTDPSDLVLDITCGSGTTAFVAEQWGRRWITCDTSRVALVLAKQRLMTATFDYFQLAKTEEGVASGFKYKTVPHVTLKSIANNEPPATETLYDQPLTDKNRARVTSPFTVEAVPAPVVQMLSVSEPGAVATGSNVDDGKPFATAQGSDRKPFPQYVSPADDSIARSGETLRQSEWRSELLRTGIRGRRGEKMMFSRVEPIAGTRFLHADAELVDSGERITDSENQETLSTVNYQLSTPQRAVVSFAPEHEPMPPTQVELALMEANRLFPKPKFVIFAAFQFDPQAVANIEQTQWQGVTLLKAQMNDDLKTADLKKSRASNESFWLIGQPDVQLKEAGFGSDGRKLYTVEVLGFDYYNVREGAIESGGTNRIAVWMLDADYDGRSIFPQQVFFPLSGEKEGWTKLAKNLKAEINRELIESYHGNISLPFSIGEYRRIAVKIVDDRGIESLKLIDI